MTNNNYLSPAMYTRHRSPSTSSSTSTKSTRLQPKSTSSTLTASRSTSRTITTLTPSISTYARRKSSVSSTASTASSTTTIATSSTSISTHHSAQLLPGSENVKVVVRCRPLAQQEFRDFARNCWDILVQEAKVRLSDYGLQKRREVNKGRQVEYRYDHVFHGSDNMELYQNSVQNIVQQAMDGYNATVFAYGQTASGKTYTMVGFMLIYKIDFLMQSCIVFISVSIVDRWARTENEPGVIPKAVDTVFDCIKQTMNREFVLRVSYLEIYNETIRDLLSPGNDNLRIHEDRRRGIYVSPLTEEVVTCPQDVMAIIRKGEANRHISTTDYNLHSSRSHTIFQMVIESRERVSQSTSLLPSSHFNAENHEAMKISQLNLIDLAGSEKAASNEERRKEGAYINKSLLTLGTVISKLTESKKSITAHIPYRDSKLTRILQPSLSGHAKIVVVCTISPTSNSLEESINTLKFAARVKKVIISASNEEVLNDKALLQRYRNEISELKSKLQTANSFLQQEKESAKSMLMAERQQHEQQLRQMRLVRSALKERIDQLTRLILTSSSVAMAPKEESSTILLSPSVSEKCPKSEQESLNNMDPWATIRKLQRELAQSQSSKANTERLLADSQQRVKELEDALDEQKELVDRVAHLEAELSVTKAELEVTKMLAQEPSKSTSSIVSYPSPPSS
ncbi:hypothetical protein VTP01DRAFT_232 [Rhizomucor pusillus]|uniref:uncharacterized protein n=1 Tax=Rhizomucor pusillus TaxID=4840 RepID=UPI0037432D77